MGVEAHIEIGDKLTPDVLAGLQLFCELSTRQFAPANIPAWRYWFNNNPFGPGVYATAKHGTEVVGFYALVPVEMRVEDRVVRGAKAEFFVVARDFRKAVVGPKAEPLPYALSRELHSAAAGFGIECIFLVSTPAAAVCHAISGAKTMTYEVDQYNLLFRGAPRAAGGQTLKRRCHTFLVAKYGAARRVFARVRRLGANRGEFEAGRWGDEMPEPVGKNLLISNSGKMLDFRFPASDYSVYATQDAEDGRAFLVFNNPRRGADVRLKHWSAQRIPFKNVAAVLEDVIHRCRLAEAISLSVTAPTSEADYLGPIGQLGFVRRRSTASLQVYSSARQAATDPTRWRITHAHIGFLGFE